MKQILVQLDDEMAARLDRVAPGRSRKRSQFVRLALGRALWDLEEQATAEAYRRQPDRVEEAHFDPGVWERESAFGSGKGRRG
jgi:predicted transcriptional regulator